MHVQHAKSVLKLPLDRPLNRAEIRRAYRQAARENHPDTTTTTTTTTRVSSQRRRGDLSDDNSSSSNGDEKAFIAVREAYELLLGLADAEAAGSATAWSADGAGIADVYGDEFVRRRRKQQQQTQERRRRRPKRTWEDDITRADSGSWLTWLLLAWPASYMVCVTYVILRKNTH